MTEKGESNLKAEGKDTERRRRQDNNVSERAREREIELASLGGGGCVKPW